MALEVGNFQFPKCNPVDEDFVLRKGSQVHFVSISGDSALELFLTVKETAESDDGFENSVICVVDSVVLDGNVLLDRDADALVVMHNGDCPERRALAEAEQETRSLMQRIFAKAA